MSRATESTWTVADAARVLRLLTACRCDEAWTSRDLHDPSCVADYREEVEVLAAAADAWRPLSCREGRHRVTGTVDGACVCGAVGPT